MMEKRNKFDNMSTGDKETEVVVLNDNICTLSAKH